MIAANAFSLAARGLREHLAESLPLVAGRILIGHPSEGAATAQGDAGNQYLNVFFYRAEYSGYPADATSQDPIYVRLFCLLTALGNAETDGNGEGNVSAGENDLRLIGGAMHALHRRPTLLLSDEGRPVAQLQIVPSPLNTDDINSLFSTQTDTSYRLSVAYELALVPVPFAEARARDRRVGGVGAAARGELSWEDVPDSGFAVRVSGPRGPRLVVDESRAGWTPKLCIVGGEGDIRFTDSFTVGSIPPEVTVIPVGATGESVALIWEAWDNVDGWQFAPAPAVPDVTVRRSRLDPDDDLASLVETVTFPLTAAGQVTLYAQRTWVRPDGGEVVLRSNPLLFTVYAD